MADKTSSKQKASKSKRARKPFARKRAAPVKGVNMDDLVGSITISVDPLEYQRSIRNEW
jgi:hypothetical protein